ncbi:MAG: Hint domain-containing protein [Paracoccaceae bacterium]
MVVRTFTAIDNDSLVDNGTGNGIINNSSTPNGSTFTYSSGGGVEITLNDTGGSSNVFDDDQSNNHTIVDGGGIVSDGQSVESESIIILQAVDEDGNLTGPEISVYVFSQGGSFGDVWGFATDTPLVDGVTYEKVSGSNAGASDYSNYMPCFAKDTWIESCYGLIRVQDIKAGQMLWTRDAGYQPVKWASCVTVEGKDNLAPVVFAPGTVGNTSELVVSQQHRMWLSDPSHELLFEMPDIFVPAKHLVGMPGVELRPTDEITYCHFMFDQHHVVRANGALSESFFLGKTSVASLESRARTELLTLFPSLPEGVDAFGASTAMTLNAREAKVLRATMQA